MTILYAVILFVLLQRLGELALSWHNTRRLLDEGAVEAAPLHYPLLVGMHAAWLVPLAIWIPPSRAPDLVFLGAFAVLQVGRLWVIVPLGRFWTTRIITLSGDPLVRRGPYQLLRHPNYVVAAAEIAVLPLAFGAWEVALVFSVVNGILLTHRVRTENRAFRVRRALAT